MAEKRIKKEGARIILRNGQHSGKKYSIKEDGTAIVFLFALAAAYFLPVLTKGNSQVLSSMGTDTWS